MAAHVLSSSERNQIREALETFVLEKRSDNLNPRNHRVLPESVDAANDVAGGAGSRQFR
jgi:hypothetical protein